MIGHPFKVGINPAQVRANEVKILVGCDERLVATVGEVLEIPLHETLRWMFEATGYAQLPISSPVHS
ncbi:hypothetical protein [Magnetospirillum molischianum]|uniref:hypothetical protein n=1 Tax=Magnetospirillum molischianum TaxID=1083 RepID=UPI0002D36269|nr:hypothetical protein [Magnetospirillum molischianum]